MSYQLFSRFYHINIQYHIDRLMITKNGVKNDPEQKRLQRKNLLGV